MMRSKRACQSRLWAALVYAVLLPLAALAQEDTLKLSGSIQTDLLISENDRAIEAETDGDWAKNCTYIDVQAQSRHADAGLRLEYLKHPLPGMERDMSGWGIPHFYLKGKTRGLELTVGSIYEQFGSGLVLRTYEERSLGIDNALMGVRVTTRPLKGLQLKALYGKQRLYWSWSDGYVGGADVELGVDEWLTALQRSNTRLTLGASWVNKEEAPDDDGGGMAAPQGMPRFVNAWDLRATLQHGAWELHAEYARKGDDPSADNGYTSQHGSAAMLSAAYIGDDLSLKLRARRSEDMAFRSERSRRGLAGMLNYLPALTPDHDYALPAQYPYATQMALGEWACQAEGAYRFGPGTWLGGPHGMELKLNYSYVRGLDSNAPTYYQDLNVLLSRRLTAQLLLNLMYMNLRYDESLVREEGEMMHCDIFVADATCQLSPTARLRAEAQYMSTRQDKGDWALGLLELSLAPHWAVTLSDKWNCGETGDHFYYGQVEYGVGNHRFRAGYGRQDDGFSCVGGVCLFMPPTKGFSLSYNYSF